ncbi:MAG: chorismate synthase, partial [Bacteroidota bacterium]
MASNSFGQLFRLTSFGESHGAAVGGVIDGCPAGLTVDEAFVQAELDRRRPGQSAIVTQRKEPDALEWLSGLYDGTTTGAPIGFLVRNKQHRSADYDHLKSAFRPSHADFTYTEKYGVRDHRGGGRASARETVARVVGGAIAKLMLAEHGIAVRGYVSQVGTVKLTRDYHELALSDTENNPVRCPDAATAAKMEALIRETRKAGDTIGGVVSAVVTGVPAGWGEPVFDKLHAVLGQAMLSINAVKGFQYGSGFGAAAMNGSAHNDIFSATDEGVTTRTNFSGGIQGGISNGQDIYFDVAFKP